MTAAGIEWWVSPWDGQTHAFRQRGEDVSQALCTHSAPTVRLANPDEGTRRCMPCLLTHGSELADQHGDAARWGG